jgi:sulfhydrogenase subunit gamma (sulfur reductase)
MFNPYHHEPAKITDITPQTDIISLFRFEFVQKVWGYNFSTKPGQFIELSIPGYGEAPFAPCNAPGEKYLELCVRDVGRLSHKLHEMKIDDRVGIRGPYGNGWPSLAGPNPAERGGQDKRSIIIVVGGLGLIPLRSLILGKDKYFGTEAKVQVFYGARLPKEMLFRYEYNKWRKNNIEINLTVDKECPDWTGCVGLVPALLDKIPLVNNAKVFVCGPPVMYKSAIAKLKQKGVNEQDIFVSLERRMHCGIGVCQHCAVGSYYTCKDGPVFAYEQIKNISGAI